MRSWNISAASKLATGGSGLSVIGGVALPGLVQELLEFLELLHIKKILLTTCFPFHVDEVVDRRNARRCDGQIDFDENTIMPFS